jgi:hypothetical protein
MDNIIEPSDDFDFSNLSLANPTGIQGGAYFTKIENNNKSLYIQTPKSLTKQGFLKNGKKIVVDLMFNNNDEKFINWIENLETKCQELIYEKGESWFQNKLELSDIETAFASPLKVYKSGKYYLMRVNVKMNYSTNIPCVKIYDESELPLGINDVSPNTNIISILEVQGIKFTSRNFQIEIELKQAMVLNTEILFENCLIKTAMKKPKDSNHFSIQTHTPGDILGDKGDSFSGLETQKGVKHDPLVFKMMEESTNGKLDESLEEVKNEEAEDEEERYEKEILNMSYEEKSDLNNDSNLKEVELNVEELVDNLEENNDDLKEFDLSSNLSSLETITLKKPNQVYYEIYKEAREKAKKAKNEAIQAFLEAKNIKKTYMLDEIDDSDSDMDIESMQF